MLRRVLLVLLSVLAVLVLVVLGRTLLMRQALPPTPVFTPPAIDANAIATRLAKAIPYRTISHQIPWEFRGSAFTEFHAYLAATYPQVHGALQREVVNDYSLLYTWPGSDPAQPGIILLAHMDVVPVEAAAEAAWTHPPFAETIADGYVWGRGAIDNKSGVITILEAAELLLGEGFTPKQTIYFAFGHDEELGGIDGAAGIAARLKERGVKAAFTLDEGSGITRGIVPGVEKPLALIGLAEKGYLTLQLRITDETQAGHSSQPPRETNIGILARAAARLEDNPFPNRLDGPMRELLISAAPEMPFAQRMVMANLWLFEPVVVRMLAASKTTAAALHTTTALTMFTAGVKENVLPREAKAVVNFRILPGDTVAGIIERTRRVVADERVVVEDLGEHEVYEAGRVSSMDSVGYRVLTTSIRQACPEGAVAPGLVLGATDSKHYYEVSVDQYRFQPMIFDNDDLKTIHGQNERVSIENLGRACLFYVQLFRNAAG